MGLFIGFHRMPVFGKAEVADTAKPTYCFISDCNEQAALLQKKSPLIFKTLELICVSFSFSSIFNGIVVILNEETSQIAQFDP